MGGFQKFDCITRSVDVRVYSQNIERTKLQMNMIFIPSEHERAFLDGDKTRHVHPVLPENIEAVMKGFPFGERFKIRVGVGPCYTAVLKDREVVVLEPTSMTLGGRQLYATLHSRDQFDPTDSEFAEQCGFESFMDMRCWYDQLSNEDDLTGIALKWDPETIQPL